LGLWGVDGLIVSGSGEAPLTAIIQSCLELGPEQAHDIVAAIDAKNLVNVTRSGAPLKPLDLSLSKQFFDSIPEPDYDEFFSTLRSKCQDEAVYKAIVDELVAIPLEGSRGCFARCDFCQNPDITSQFRTLKGKKVAERALAICEKYGRSYVYFADSVCNSWAEEYADTLLSAGRKISAFMEMRVHAPESFFTKLGLSGATEMQLGIEAISEPLLHAMSKGTTVIQNLSAAKYLAELRVKCPSNLIIHHPKSTVADVEETMRMVRLIEHFPPFSLSRFVISYASPIYKQLDDEKKSQLIRGFDWLPPELVKYSFPRDLAYSYPAGWLDPDVAAAWTAFRSWYEAHAKRVAANGSVFTCKKKGDGEVLVVDTRFGQSLRYTLTGAAAQIFTLCHNPLKVAQIEERSGMNADTVKSILTEFVERSVLTKVGDRYLTLALRPREELVENLLRNPKPDKIARRSLPQALSASEHT